MPGWSPRACHFRIEIANFEFRIEKLFHVEKQTPDINTSLRTVVDSVICFWTLARILTMLPHNCVRKLETLYEEWLALQNT